MTDRYMSRDNRPAEDFNVPPIEIASTAGAMKRAHIRYFLSPAEAVAELPDGERITAKQAASCLLSPAIGDQVLLLTGSDIAYILAVLERAAPETAEISVAGADHVSLNSAATITLNAPEVRLLGKSIALFAERVHQAGTTLSRNFQRVLTTASEISTTVKSMITQADIRTSIVREVDKVEAGTLIHEVEGISSHSSEIGLINARQEIQLDAKRVNVS